MSRPKAVVPLSGAEVPLQDGLKLLSAKRKYRPGYRSGTASLPVLSGTPPVPDRNYRLNLSRMTPSTKQKYRPRYRSSTASQPVLSGTPPVPDRNYRLKLSRMTQSTKRKYRPRYRSSTASSPVLSGTSPVPRVVVPLHRRRYAILDPTADPKR